MLLPKLTHSMESSTKPSIAALEDANRYRQLAKLPYTDMIPFMQSIFQQRTNRVVRSYLALNAVLLVGLTAIGAYQLGVQYVTFSTLFTHLFIGFGITFTLLIPVHEAIHGIAYKLAGAPRVSYGGNWRKFYFYAVADRFVVGSKAFHRVALAPFLAISVACVMGAVLLPSWQWVAWGVLLLHTGACAGDFGMLAFYQQHQGGRIFTFDDVAAQTAYFYQEIYAPPTAQEHIS